MLVRHSLTLTIVSVWAMLLPAQSLPVIDTLVTDEGATNMLLNIKVTSGEMYLTSSGLCGKSMTKLSQSSGVKKANYSSKVAVNGTISRTLNLENPEVKAKPAPFPSGTATMRLATGSKAEGTSNYRSEYKQDPSLDTELRLDLGSGGTWLDLSSMSMRQVHIKSAFSDVLVSYNRPNVVRMEEMNIHVMNAQITLKNLELAKARKVDIRNEMGDTKLIIGAKGRPASQIHLKTGVGDCTLIIDKAQPTKLILAGGVFSTIEIEEGFNKHGKGTYVNNAYHSNPGKCTTVYCEADVGDISVMAK